MNQKSHADRMLWAQFDALEMGTGWDDLDINKPQIMVESAYGDSHPGSWHLNQLVEQAVYGVYEKGGKPAKYYATDICDGCAQGHDGMNAVLASREALANMVEVHASAVPWDGMILSSSCDKSIPAHLKAAARMDIPTIFMPGGSMRPGPQSDHFSGGWRYLPAPEAQGRHHRAGSPGLQADRLSLGGRLHLPGYCLHHAVCG